ncbi:thioredoxin-related protein [Lewinella marina]|uniref:Thioredoxin n=1 Tax=Neolewinella marina TaxID=438751 RepID=A0A2G0CFW9_9BACT|nr:DUF255 domain-containing protein [Neolewinella marina]NJB85504.1 thioredoxin-related protein [Neolewinella marina]PHK98807.1 thioredoxin [Neolewinella marina]
MKFLFPLLLLFLSASLSAQIEWLSWEEAVARNASEPRKMMVDVYTDWCGWCKRMDKTSFVDPAVTEYVNEHFYAVKLNAEQREPIQFDGHEFTYDPTLSRRGVHTLAVALLDGRMSYPSIVYLDKEQKRITIAPGFKEAEALLQELTYVGGDHFKRQSYADYVKSQAKK